MKRSDLFVIVLFMALCIVTGFLAGLILNKPVEEEEVKPVPTIGVFNETMLGGCTEASGGSCFLYKK